MYLSRGGEKTSPKYRYGKHREQRKHKHRVYGPVKDLNRANSELGEGTWDQEHRNCFYYSRSLCSGKLEFNYALLIILLYHRNNETSSFFPSIWNNKNLKFFGWLGQKKRYFGVSDPINRHISSSITSPCILLILTCTCQKQIVPNQKSYP